MDTDPPVTGMPGQEAVLVSSEEASQKLGEMLSTEQNHSNECTPLQIQRCWGGCSSGYKGAGVGVPQGTKVLGWVFLRYKGAGWVFLRVQRCWGGCSSGYKGAGVGVPQGIKVLRWVDGVI